MIKENNIKPTILIVDDSFTNRELLKKIFEKEFNTVVAENGVIALSKLNELRDVAAVVLDIEMPELDGFGVLAAMQRDKKLAEIPVVVDTIVDDINSQLKALDGGAVDILIKPFNPQIALHRIRNIIARQENAREAARAQSLEELLRQSEIDEKTGFYNKQAFCRKSKELILANPDKDYVILRWDIDHFKVYNDMYGVKAGDEFLSIIGEAVMPFIDNRMVYGRWGADHFVICLEKERFEKHNIVKQITDFRFNTSNEFEFFIRLGIYEVVDRDIEVELMCDRALLALQSIKGDFDTRYAYYDNSMRSAMLDEQEIVGEMKQALDSEQFITYLQPQYNYSSSKLIGAEALVRWRHPQKGLVPPFKFIPIFERNGFISKLDEYICRSVCRQLRAWIDAGIAVVPISINISRKDIYNPHLADNIIKIVNEYNIPTSLLRLEITESAYMENAEQLIKTVEEMREFGFAVEMDDFGSGYSSLNTLKSVPVDKLKLDIKFLEASNDGDNSKGGSILSSVVRMANWLKLSIIAEGVETKEQAEYLKSIGCLHMQGYFFARPIPVEEFEKLLTESGINANDDIRFTNNIQGAADFLSNSTQATLLFNSFVGGAGIMEFDGENIEALRLNDRFFEEFGIDREDYSDYITNLLKRFDDKNKERYIGAIKKAISTGKESCCNLVSLPFNDDGNEIYTKTRIRILAENAGRYIFYVAVENITERVRISE